MNAIEIELLDDPQGEAKWHERRVLFFHAMRHPEMRWVLECFKHLKHDQDIDWQNINEIEIDPPWDHPWDLKRSWIMETDRFVSILLAPDQYDGITDFMTVMHHDPANPYCECYDGTMAKRRMEAQVA